MVLDRATYRMAKERHRVWQCHTNGDTQVGDIAVRLGRVRVDVEEIDAKLVLAGIVKRASER